MDGRKPWWITSPQSNNEETEEHRSRGVGAHEDRKESRAKCRRRRGASFRRKSRRRKRCAHARKRARAGGKTRPRHAADVGGTTRATCAGAGAPGKAARRARRRDTRANTIRIRRNRAGARTALPPAAVSRGLVQQGSCAGCAAHNPPGLAATLAKCRLLNAQRIEPSC